MKKAAGLLGVVLALGVGFFIFKTQMSTGPTGAPPRETIDVTGVESDLLGIAQAERVYLASHGSYASLEELQQDGSLTFSGANRRGYAYSVEVDDGRHFKVTAAPSDPAKKDWPTLSIDDTMQVVRQ